MTFPWAIPNLQRSQNEPLSSSHQSLNGPDRFSSKVHHARSLGDLLSEQRQPYSGRGSGTEEVLSWDYERLGASNDDLGNETKAYKRLSERDPRRNISQVPEVLNQDEELAGHVHKSSLARAHTTGRLRGHGRRRKSHDWQDSMSSVDHGSISSLTEVDPLLLESTRYPSISQLEARNYRHMPPHSQHELQSKPVNVDSNFDNNSLYSEPSVRNAKVGEDTVGKIKPRQKTIENALDDLTLETGISLEHEPIATRGKRLVEERSRWLQETRNHHDQQARSVRPFSQTPNTSAHGVDWQGFLDTYDSTPGAFPEEAEFDDRPIDIDDGEADLDPWEQREPITLPPLAPSARMAHPERTVRFNDQTTTIGESNNHLAYHDHEDATSVRRVQECAESLRTLEFGKRANGGIDMERLIVYAQAADGNLESAMDIIEEELKAHMGNLS